jgi:hypothetical protein
VVDADAVGQWPASRSARPRISTKDFLGHQRQGPRGSGHGAAAITATLIATCGLYGLMAYAVTQRRREIGVRMALGAGRGDVLRLVLTRALGIVITGLVAGLAGAVRARRGWGE